MLQDYINKQIPIIIKQRNMSLVFGMGMLIANVFLSWGLLHKSERVILVPPEISKTMWISNNQASTEYLEEMSIFLSGLMLDQTPSSSKVKRDILLKYVDPGYYNTLYKKLTQQEEYLSKNDISTKFYLKEIQAAEKTKQVLITGEQSNFIADSVVKKEQVTYLLKFEYRGAKYLLSEFKQIKEESDD